MNDEDHQAITRTRNWVEKFVIKHNFCPFAGKPMLQDKIRITTSDVSNEKDIIDDLVIELTKIKDTAASELETTLLVMTNCLDKFEDYNQFLDVVDAILEEMELIGEIQVASFHPRYQFADLTVDDVRNYTNRSPYPMFHLIREDSVEKARESYPDVDEIPDRNMELLETLGLETVTQTLKDINSNH